jgi:hypothetical protein
MENLGRKAQDIVTGFCGTITGHCTYLSGCNQYLLVPPTTGEGNYREGQWFDVQRVRVDTTTPAIELDNSKTPGFDKPAPKR